MIRFLKSSFLWQFAGGFTLGAIGLLTLTPAAEQTPGAPTQQVR